MKEEQAALSNLLRVCGDGVVPPEVLLFFLVVVVMVGRMRSGRRNLNPKLLGLFINRLNESRMTSSDGLAF
jgi:hypothetical protein